MKSKRHQTQASRCLLPVPQIHLIIPTVMRADIPEAPLSLMFRIFLGYQSCRQLQDLASQTPVSQRNRGKKNNRIWFTKNYIHQHKLSIKLVLCGPRPQKCSCQKEYSKTQRVQLPGAVQEPVLKSGLSWECEGFEQLTPEELT